MMGFALVYRYKMIVFLFLCGFHRLLGEVKNILAVGLNTVVLLLRTHNNLLILAQTGAGLRDGPPFHGWQPR